MSEDWSKYAVKESDSKTDEEQPKEDWSKYAEKEKPGIVDRISEGITKFAQEHPKVREAAQRLLTGTSPENEQELRRQGIGEIQGQNLEEIPGTKILSEGIRRAGRESGEYWKGFASSLLGDVVDLAGSGFDPRAASREKIPYKVGEVVPDDPELIPESRRLGQAPFTSSPTGAVNPREFPIRRSSEIPYRSPESYTTAFGDERPPVKRTIRGLLPEETQTSLEDKQLPIKRAKALPPDMLQPNEEELYNEPRKSNTPNPEDLAYELTKRKLGGLQKTKENNIIDLTKKPDIFNHIPDIEGKTLMTGERVRDLTGMEPKEAISKGIIEQDPETMKYRVIQKSKPTAVYAFEQPGLEGESTSMYHIKGGDYDRSTVSEQKLKELGIEVPQKDEGVQFARSEKGGIKVGVDIKRNASELASGYSTALPGIMAREGLQNAIDATRHLGNDAKISVDTTNNSIKISDNGKGMNRQELETVFSDLHSSGKTSESGATGGKGIGKATYMLGGEHFKAVSVKFERGKKIEYSIEGTPDDFMQHVDVHEREVPLITPTGTTIITKLKEGQDAWDAKGMVNNVIQHTRGVKGTITTKHHTYDDPQTQNFSQGEGDKVIGKTNIEGHDVAVSIPKNEELKPRSHVWINVLNNGMFQYSKYLGIEADTPNMPEHVIVDIHPNAEEGTPEYPFPTQRESLKQKMQEGLDQYIQEKLIKPEQQGRKNVLKELYASMPVVPVGRTARPTVFFDPGERLTKSELEEFQTSPVINSITKLTDRAIDNILKASGNKDWATRLERVGIVLDPNMHGVHIPNPETNKSTILINPFEHIDMHNPESASLRAVVTMMHEAAHVGTELSYKGGKGEIAPSDLKDPRIGEYLQSYLNQSMVHGGLDPGHGVIFLKRLGDIYSKYGAKNALAEADKYQQIITDDSGRYNAEVQRLLQIYKDSRRRAETKTDFLSGTGTKQADRTSRRKGGSSGDGKSDGERTASAVTKLLSALEEARSLNEEQRSIYATEKARRFAAFEKVKDEGMSGAAKSLGKLKGEYDRVENTVRLPLSKDEVNTLFTAIKRANITTGEKARGYVAMFKLLDNGEVPQRNELRLLDDVFGNGFADHILELHGGIGAVGIKLAKAANTMKSMMTLIHFSAPLRQGIGLIHKSEWRSAFVEMFKYFGNKEYYDAAMQAIEQRPNYLLSREAGLFMAKLSSMLSGEEAFMNNYIPELKSGLKSLYVKNLYDASQRSYLGFLNKLRADVFDDLIADAKKMGHQAFTVVDNKDEETGEISKRIVPSKSTENIAKFINISTGRGSLGALDKITPELNTVIWSPRLIASRLAVLNPRYYMALDSFTRKEAIKSLFAIATASSAMLVLAKLAGAKVSNDPTSADFHKARFGNSVMDPNGGYQQPIVAASRMIAEANRMGSGRKAKYNEPNIPEIGMNFIRSKESPMANLIDTIASAKQFTGGGGMIDRFNNKTTIQGEVLNRFRPIFEQDMNKLIHDDPDMKELLLAGSANLFGAGLQDYPEKGVTANRNLMRLRIR